VTYPEVVDEVIRVEEEAAFETARRVAREEGDVVRHPWQRRGVGGAPGGAPPGQRRQADRRRPARPRGALPQYVAVPGRV